MKNPNSVTYKSITVRIKKRTTTVNGTQYTNWEIRDHTSGFIG